jgi:hypothetical protein
MVFTIVSNGRAISSDGQTAIAAPAMPVCFRKLRLLSFMASIIGNRGKPADTDVLTGTDNPPDVEEAAIPPLAVIGVSRIDAVCGHAPSSAGMNEPLSSQ